jgi:hypothetical protein
MITACSGRAHLRLVILLLSVLPRKTNLSHCLTFPFRFRKQTQTIECDLHHTQPFLLRTNVRCVKSKVLAGTRQRNPCTRVIVCAGDHAAQCNITHHLIFLLRVPCIICRVGAFLFFSTLYVNENATISLIAYPSSP